MLTPRTRHHRERRQTAIGAVLLEHDRCRCSAVPAFVELGRGHRLRTACVGQTARAGHKIRPALRDIIKKIPKRRGFGKNRGRTVWEAKPRPQTVTLAQLSEKFDAGAEVTLAALREKGIVRNAKSFKVVGSEVSKKFTIKGATISAGAKAAIEKAGGSIAQ